MSDTPTLTAGFWRTRRSAAVAGIVFGVLLIMAMLLIRLALLDDSYATFQADADRRDAVRRGLQLVPFAGIAFLWFIGVIRDQLGDVEDRLFSTVFLGSGLLFVGLLFTGAVTASSMVSMLEGPAADSDVWAFALDNSQGLVSDYAMRMAAVFTVSVSTAARRAAALPRWVSTTGYAVALTLFLAPLVQQNWLQLLFPCWVLLVSVVLLTTAPARSGSAAAPTPRPG